MRRLRLAACGAIAVGIFAAPVLVGCDSGCPEGQDLTVTNWVHTGKTTTPIYGCR